MILMKKILSINKLFKKLKVNLIQLIQLIKFLDEIDQLQLEQYQFIKANVNENINQNN